MIADSFKGKKSEIMTRGTNNKHESLQTVIFKKNKQTQNKALLLKDTA